MSWYSGIRTLSLLSIARLCIEILQTAFWGQTWQAAVTKFICCLYKWRNYNNWRYQFGLSGRKSEHGHIYVCRWSCPDLSLNLPTIEQVDLWLNVLTSFNVNKSACMHKKKPNGLLKSLLACMSCRHWLFLNHACCQIHLLIMSGK